MTETASTSGTQTLLTPAAASSVAAESTGRRVGLGLQRMPQLDGLRAFAVSGVVFYHYSGGHVPHAHYCGYGVQLFFVLSGFLITGILLHSRTLADRTGGSRLRLVGQFMARRFLRIFPLFYFVVAVLYWLDWAGTRHNWVWHATYTTNIFIARIGAWPGPIGHFWSLAVEEQFYLVWPWLILYIPRRALAPLIVCTIIAGPAFRALAVALSVNDVTARVLPFGQLDALGLGALLAWTRWSGGLDSPVPIRPRVWIVVAVLAALVDVLPGSGRAVRSLRESVGLFGWHMIFVGLVAKASVGFGGWTGRLLTAVPVVFVGTISYGIYVYHGLLPDFVKMLNLPVRPQAILFVAGTLLVASASWYLLERPINSLKSRVPYRA